MFIANKFGMCALQRCQQDKNVTGKIKEGKENQNRENLITMFLKVLLLILLLPGDILLETTKQIKLK